MRGLHFTSSKTSSPSQSPMSATSHHQTFSASIMEEDLLDAEQIINRWDLNSPLYSKFDSLFTGDKREARMFVNSVKNLQAAMHMFVAESASSEKIIHAQKLMQVAMKRLEKEFYQILSSNRDVLDSESVSVSARSSRARSSVSDDDNASEEDSSSVTMDFERVSVSEIVMADLKMIADCMISSGYAKECVKVYKVIRKSIVDETMYNLGFVKFSFNQINKMDWDVMDKKIKTWLYAAKISMKSLFYGERILCDYVFSSSEKIRESCFSEICKEKAISLFEFPELVAKSKKSIERMFRTLDLYNAISDQWPDIEMIFSWESMVAVRTQAVTSLRKLCDAVRAMLTDFETAIQKEAMKSPVNGGGIHPLTRYVMNYLICLSDYSGALSDIVADWPVQIQSPLPDSYSSITNPDESSISSRFAWLVLVLLCKIDAGAQLYKDVAQSYLFLVNNLNYVVSKVDGSNLCLLIGHDWLVKHEQKVRKYAGNYERMAWSRVISSLPVNPTDDITIEEARNCFRRFNLEFNEAYRKQSTWIITDHKVRDKIKISIAKKILPAYRAFYQKYRGVFQGADSVVKYAPDDLGNYLSDLFHGTGAPGSVSTTSHSSSSSSSFSSSSSRSH